MSEGLRTGWEPDRPTGDTVLGDYVASWSDWLESIATACGDRFIREDDMVLHDGGSTAMFGNTGLLTQPITGDGRALVSRIREFYDGAPGAGRGWCSAHGQHPLLGRGPRARRSPADDAAPGRW